MGTTVDKLHKTLSSLATPKIHLWQNPKQLHADGSLLEFPDTYEWSFRIPTSIELNHFPKPKTVEYAWETPLRIPRFSVRRHNFNLILTSAVQQCPQHQDANPITTSKLNGCAWDTCCLTGGCQNNLSIPAQGLSSDPTAWKRNKKSRNCSSGSRWDFFLESIKKQQLCCYLLCRRQRSFFTRFVFLLCDASTACIWWRSHLFVSDKAGRRKRSWGREPCEPIYTSREEPERCWGHTKPGAARWRRHNGEHAHLTFNQDAEISALRQGAWRARNNEPF